jgi:hypothetical protein
MKIDTFREEMQTLCTQRAFSSDFVLPDYAGLSVKNISSIVGKVFGISSLKSTSFPESYVDDLQGIEKVVLVILDGFGYNRLLTHLSSNDGTFSELVQKGVLKPITTVFPSTTSTVLTSIFTGLSPAEHNIIGYHMFSKEYGLVFNTLEMKPVYGYSHEVDLAEDYSRKVRPWIKKLQEHNIKTIVATRWSIAGSGLSRVIHRDQDIIPYILHSDMFVQCGKALEHEDPTLLIIYYPGIDTLAHRYGCYSEEATSEINSIECNLNNFLKSLSEKTKKKTLMIITADHGIADTRKTYYLKDLPDLDSKLMLPPVGDSRTSFLFAKPGKNDALMEAFRRNIDGFQLIPSAELIQKGVFGEISRIEQLKQSVGDFAALSTSQNAIQYPFFEGDRVREMIGSHGGMSAEEIVVPLLSIRLSKL